MPLRGPEVSLSPEAEAEAAVLSIVGARWTPQ